jgi:hypothetical protein
MTDYSAISNGEIASGQPGKNGVFLRLRDNPLAIMEGNSTIKIQWAAMATVPGQSLYDWTTPGTHSLVIPAGVTSIEATAIGGGGMGIAQGDPVMAAPGGGGERRLGRIAVTPGETLTVVIGAAPTGGTGPGIDTTISRGATVLMRAKGAANAVGGTGGTGGTGSNGEHGGYVPFLYGYQHLMYACGAAPGEGKGCNGAGGIWVDGAGDVITAKPGRVTVRF